MATYNEEHAGVSMNRRKTKKVKVNTEFDFSEHLKGFMKEDKLRVYYGIALLEKGSWLLVLLHLYK